MEVVTAWIDASSLATGVVESGEPLIEDACWLRPACEDKHINLAELDAMLRRINLALQWKATGLHLKTDSAYVHQWVTDALSEMLIRRRLSTINELVVEYELTVDVELVRFQANRASTMVRRTSEGDRTSGCHLHRRAGIHSHTSHSPMQWTSCCEADTIFC